MAMIRALARSRHFWQTGMPPEPRLRTTTARVARGPDSPSLPGIPVNSLCCSLCERSDRREPDMSGYCDVAPGHPAEATASTSTNRNCSIRR